MLPLDSPVWAELTHAYGSAGDIPGLLRQLQGLPECNGEEEPWSSLWSSLAHQGDVYSATFAAVPYVIAALAADPLRADWSYLHFPAWVEICRHKNGVEVPENLLPAYSESLGLLPRLVAAAAGREWDSGFLQSALGAIAVAKGNSRIAEAVLELDGDVVDEFLGWFRER